MEVANYYQTDRLPILQEAQEIFKWSHELAKCPFYQKLGSGGIIAILLTARELGLPPMACLNGGLYHIDGKVSISAQMMNTLLLKAGHRADIHILNEKKCVLHFKRADRKEIVEYTYTIEDAQKAGYLNKNNYKAHLKDMLFCRCLSGGARKICPDAIGNAYVHGELSSDPNSFDATNFEMTEDVEEEKAKVKSIGFEKAEGFDDFVKKHGLDRKKEKKAEYVQLIAKTSNKTENEVINFAVSNEKGFLDAFENWEKEGVKKSPNKQKEEPETSSPDSEPQKSG